MKYLVTLPLTSSSCQFGFIFIVISSFGNFQHGDLKTISFNSPLLYSLQPYHQSLEDGSTMPKNLFSKTVLKCANYNPFVTLVLLQVMSHKWPWYCKITYQRIWRINVWDIALTHACENKSGICLPRHCWQVIYILCLSCNKCILNADIFFSGD
jgi:hypothetical protein